MNCEAVREMLWAYLEKETTAEETVKIEEHLKNCGDCREELKLQQEMMEMLSGLPEEELPEGFHAELMQKLSAEAKPNIVPFPQKKKKQPMFKQWSMIAAAVLVVVAAGGMNGMLEMRKTQNAAVSDLKTTEAADSVDAATEEEMLSVAEDMAEMPLGTQAEKTDAPKMKAAPAAGAENTPVAAEGLEEQASIPEAVSFDALTDDAGFTMMRSVNLETTDEAVLTVADLTAAMDALQEAIADAGGFEESAEAEVILASIPAENFESFVKTVTDIGSLEWTLQAAESNGVESRTVEIHLITE